MSIWAHTLVKNEDRYLWFAVTSVVDYVDKVLLWDTGSTDDTIKVAKELKRRYLERVDFRQVVQKDIYDFTDVRQQMLNETRSSWLMILDGDEVWWDQKIRQVVQVIKERSNGNLETIVTPYYNVVGDIFHYQEESAGMYSIDSKKGHYNIRFVNRQIPELHFNKPHGQQGLFDRNGVLIQDREKTNRKLVDAKCYLHFTNVLRSTKNDYFVPKRKTKMKYELGVKFQKDFYYPEAFFKPAPPIVPSPWRKMGGDFVKKALLQTPIKKVKRRFFSRKVGY